MNYILDYNFVYKTNCFNPSMATGYWFQFHNQNAYIKELEKENEQLKQENKALQEEMENSNKMLKDLGVTTFDIIVESEKKKI